MAEIDILLQGLNKDDDHETAVNKLLSIPAMENYLFGLAFARSNGVERIRSNLGKVSDKTRVFIGIRNGVTSVQSISSFLKIGIAPYVVDTASNSKIFHQKIYAAYSNAVAHVIIGSANLTNGGLNQNIEASSYIRLDRERQADEKCFQKLINTIQGLPVTYPDHVFQVKTARRAVELLKEGRLEDERLTRLPSTNKKHDNRERDNLIPIPTHGRKIRSPRKGVKKRLVKKTVNTTALLVWESKPLPQRSLNIPQEANTHITGDVNLGKGLMEEDIDFQHYFRDVVFSELTWHSKPSSRSPHLERATINAELIIKNISYGVYDLEVNHDPRRNTRSYKQRNVTTKIKWGNAITVIRKRDLLGRTLKLYKKNSTDFAIVID
ncbi:MAG: phospholipase D family protein [Nitrospira sp.]|nr:phospholipase D family protein [Nitrospira sp.]